MSKKIIIDTDTASDDAFALVMALRDPALEVVAITTVNGNIGVELATRNALMSIDYAKSYRPPVYSGASRPLVRERHDASYVHGKDGMGDTGTFREPTGTAESEDAVTAMLRIIREGDGDIELVTLGPLTNVAFAILQEPETMKKVPHITMMAGAAYKGNVSPTAEFNIWADAEAADVVCAFSVPFTMATIEACHSCASYDEAEITRLEKTGSEIAAFCIACNATTMNRSDGEGKGRLFRVPDPTAIAILTHPEFGEDVFTAYTRVETKGSKMTYGMTVHDRRDERFMAALGDPFRKHNSKIVASMNEKAFKDYVYSLIVEEEKQ